MQRSRLVFASSLIPLELILWLHVFPNDWHCCGDFHLSCKAQQIKSCVADMDHRTCVLILQTYDLQSAALQADGSVKAREDTRRKNAHPSDTLFVVNFDVHRTREQDIEYHFEPYGRLLRVQIKRNYAFVQFETVDQAAEALKRTHGSELMGRPLTVEFVANEDPYVTGRGSPPRRGR